MTVNRSTGYWLALAAAGLLALLVAWAPLGAQFDNYALDWTYRLHRPAPWPTSSVVLAIDDASYKSIGGVGKLRAALAQSLALVVAAQPKAIALDVVLADSGDPADDDALEPLLPHVVLPAVLTPTDGWELPQERFRKVAPALGHVHADPDSRDGMSRAMPLEKRAAGRRLWALSLEAFRLASGGGPITESPSDLEVGGVLIPASLAGGRLMRIRYLPPGENETSRIPHVTVKALLANPSLAEAFRGKVVFVGATSQSAVRDRLMTPYTTLQPMPGVEIHAHAYETMATGQFLTDAAPSLVLLLSVALVAGAALIFRRFTGLPAYSLAAALLGIAHLIPHIFFMSGMVFSHVAPMLAAWFAVVVAAAWQYFSTRLALATAEGERARYQQAIQFVTHEMRTPLTAIQGSSELMGRYKLTEEKQKQLAAQINSESKRLARMIQTFLDVERLGAGQMQLKQDPVPVPALLNVCLDRARPLAERKNIALDLLAAPELTLQGDRELLEYALYNLLTNAVKYSPPDTRVELSATAAPGRLGIAVRDQGMGMSPAELKKLFTRFYRTTRAEQSGEVGTGIGLSIVQQIVQLHGGRIEVTSEPGAGSCFTLSLPVR